MSVRHQHMLIVGNGRDIPGLVHDIQPIIRTTMLVRTAVVGRVRKPQQHCRVIGLDPNSPDDWIATAREIHARDPFGYLGSFSEKDQDKAAVIGEMLHLPSHQPRTVRWVHDKAAMRARLAACGLDDTVNQRVDDVEQVIRFADNVGYPIVLKPVNGAASSGVSVIRSSHECVAAWTWGKNASEPDNDDLVVERFLEGRELSVEAFSDRSLHTIVALTDKVKEPRHCVEIGHMVRGDFDDATVEQVGRYVTAVLDALEIRDGVTHTEIILTNAGPRVVETHLRPAGDDIPEMIRDTYGLDLIELLVRQSLGEDVTARVRDGMTRVRTSPDRAAICYSSPRASGVIIGVDGVEQARQTPGVTAVDVLVDVGDRVTDELTDSRARAVAARAIGATPHAALMAAREAANAVRFTIHADPVGGELPGAPQ